MGYDPNICAKQLTDKGFVPTCDPEGQLPNHCEGFMTTALYHSNCVNQNLYAPVQFICCQNSSTSEIRCFPLSTVYKDCQDLHNQDPNWNPVSCYCCCACFARDTPIATPDGDADIYTLGVGSSVLTARRAAGSAFKLDWQASKLSFSSGTGTSSVNPVMMYLVYGTREAPRDMVCSPDQPFLLPDGRLIRAKQLVVGDKLMGKDGDAVPILLCSIGEYTGGVHHISTGAPFNNSIDGHLLLAGGLVAGDFELQTSFDSLPPDAVAHDIKQRASIGTPEYEHALGPNVSRQKARVLFGVEGQDIGKLANGARLMREGKFTSHRSPLAETLVPPDAQSLFTDAQAQDIVANGSQVPVSNPLPAQLFELVRRQLLGFYPDIKLAYDPLDLSPNVHAFDFYGTKYVLISGGLARLVGFNYEAIMMAAAWGIACFTGGNPKGSRGLSAIGECDYWAFGIISRQIWAGRPWLEYSQAAMNQWFAIFDLIGPEHRQGDPSDPLNYPSIDCRKQAIENGNAGGALPECAGGEALPKVALEQATALSLTEVQLVFSVSLTDSALDPSHYTLRPPAKVKSAAFAGKNFIVNLTTELTSGQQYEVTVAGLSSYLNTGVDPAHASASFKAP